MTPEQNTIIQHFQKFAVIDSAKDSQDPQSYKNTALMVKLELMNDTRQQLLNNWAKKNPDKLQVGPTESDLNKIRQELKKTVGQDSFIILEQTDKTTFPVTKDQEDILYIATIAQSKDLYEPSAYVSLLLDKNGKITFHSQMLFYSMDNPPPAQLAKPEEVDLFIKVLHLDETMLSKSHPITPIPSLKDLSLFAVKKKEIPENVLPATLLEELQNLKLAEKESNKDEDESAPKP